jgi:hypothetical protein
MWLKVELSGLMKQQDTHAVRILPPLECETIPITDPDEIAALERRIREAEKKLAGKTTGRNKKTRSRKP